MSAHIRKFSRIRREVVSKASSYLCQYVRTTNRTGAAYDVLTNAVRTDSNAPVIFLPWTLQSQLKQLPPILRARTQNLAAAYCNRHPRLRTFVTQQYKALSDRLDANAIRPSFVLRGSAGRLKSSFSTGSAPPAQSAPTSAAAQQPGLYKRLKTILKDYWYLSVPVHIVNSAAWFGLSYWLVRSGLDVVRILEWLHFPDAWIEKLKKTPTAGHVAFAFALYKVFTPFRYILTVSLTGLAIRYFTRWGWIKPFPTKAKMKEKYVELTHRFRERKGLRQKRHKWPE